MKKLNWLLFLSFFISVYCYSQTTNDVHIIIEVTNIEINGGKIYLAIFSSAESHRNETPDYPFLLVYSGTMAYQELFLPPGEYVISAFQDNNNNGRLDRGLFGIPKEPCGISNYFGKGYPSENFERQKISINNTTGRITIRLYRF